MQIRGEVIIITIVAAAITLSVAFGFLAGKTEASDQKILSDIKQINAALKIYHDENGYYPYGTGTPMGLDNYLSFWPKPANDGSCSKITEYSYTQKLSGNDYSLAFCLNGSSGQYLAGLHTASVEGIN